MGDPFKIVGPTNLCAVFAVVNLVLGGDHTNADNSSNTKLAVGESAPILMYATSDLLTLAVVKLFMVTSLKLALVT